MNKNYFSYEGCVFDNETFNIKSNGKSFFSPIPIFYKPKIEKKLFITINYTNQCNLNCDYCYRNKKDKVKANATDSKRLLDQTLSLIERKMKKKYEEFVFSFGLTCEPMLNLNVLKQLFETIENKENYMFTEKDFKGDVKIIVKSLEKELNAKNQNNDDISFLNQLLLDRELKNKLKFNINDIDEKSRFIIFNNDIHILRVIRLNRSILESKFKKLIKVKKQVMYTFWCMSNGTIVNNDVIQFIKQTGINPFWISIDVNKKSHDEHRPFYDKKDSFDIVKQNITILTKNGIDVKLSTVITNPNDDLLSYLYEAQKLHVKKVHMTFWRKKDSYTNDNLENLKNQYRKVYHQLYKDILQGDYKLLLLLSEDKITEPLRFLLRREKLIRRCDWGRQLIIDSYGDVWPCLYFAEKENYKIANIYHKKLKVIKSKIPENSYSKECFNCSVRTLCGGYCRYTAIMENDSIDKKSEFECALRKLFAEESLKLLIDLYKAGYNLKKLYYDFLDK